MTQKNGVKGNIDMLNIGHYMGSVGKLSDQSRNCLGSLHLILRMY